MAGVVAAESVIGCVITLTGIVAAELVMGDMVLGGRATREGHREEERVLTIV